jgi:hypothetical protein
VAEANAKAQLAQDRADAIASPRSQDSTNNVKKVRVDPNSVRHCPPCLFGVVYHLQVGEVADAAQKVYTFARMFI